MMKTKPIAAICAIIIGLALGGSPVASAAPGKSGFKSVTYSVSVKSGSGLDSVIQYTGSAGKTWVIKNAPWSTTVKMGATSMPWIHITSRTRDGKWPTYVCSIRVNGVVKSQKEGYGGVQCLQSY